MMKKEVIKLLETINVLGDRPYGSKFSLALVHNKKYAKDIVNALQKDISDFRKTKEYRDYQDGLEEVKVKMCKKGKNGKPDLVRDAYGQFEYQFEDQDAFDKEIEKFKKKNKKISDLEEKLSENYKNGLEEEVDFKFYKVDSQLIPDTIEANYLEVIMPMIKEQNKIIS